MGCIVFWGTLAQQIVFYHHHYSSLNLHVKSLQVYTTSSSLEGIMFFSWCYVWKIISSLALWITWKVRCFKICTTKQTNVLDQVKSFWELLVIYTIKGEYDSYKGYGTTTNRKEGEFEECCQLFLLCWMQVMMLSGTMFHLVGCFNHRRHSYYILS